MGTLSPSLRPRARIQEDWSTSEQIAIIFTFVRGFFTRVVNTTRGSGQGPFGISRVEFGWVRSGRRVCGSFSSDSSLSFFPASSPLTHTYLHTYHRSAFCWSNFVCTPRQEKEEKKKEKKKHMRRVLPAFACLRATKKHTHQADNNLDHLHRTPCICHSYDTLQ